MTNPKKDVPEDVEDAALNLFHRVEKDLMTSLGALQVGGDNNPVHHLYMSLVAAAGAIQTAARIMSVPQSKAEFEKWMDRPLDRHTIMAAALMLSRSLIPNQTGFTFQYSPQNIKAALEATKKITGNSDTSMFTKSMVTAAYKSPSPIHIFDNSHLDASGGDNVVTIH